MKKIGVLTSGGDSPGMNAAVRSVVRYGVHNGRTVVGVIRGFSGLLTADFIPLDHRSVSGIISRGGTIIKTGRCPEFLDPQARRQACENLKKHAIDGLIVIGGNGSYRGAHALATECGFPCIGIPGTIDNDISGTDTTIGAATAVHTALDAIDKIRDTATSLERIFIVEVMGRESGFIALQVALSGGAEDVLIPEQKFDLDAMCSDIAAGKKIGKHSWIIVVAEGAAKAPDVAAHITKNTGFETRVVILGHIQRGGSPLPPDRITGTRLGAAAVDLLIKGASDKAAGIVADEVNVVDLAYAISKKELKIEALYRLIRILT
jgi:6-phosphofructokinase 1